MFYDYYKVFFVLTFWINKFKFKIHIAVSNSNQVDKTSWIWQACPCQSFYPVIFFSSNVGNTAQKIHRSVKCDYIKLWWLFISVEQAMDIRWLDYSSEST